MMAKKKVKGALRSVGTIVKRRGVPQEFKINKLIKSIDNAARSAQLPEPEVDKLTEATSSQIKNWIKGRKVATSDEIFKKVSGLLRKKSKEAAYMYKTHRDVN